MITRLHPQGKGGPEETSCARRHQIYLIRFMTWQFKILPKSFYYRFGMKSQNIGKCDKSGTTFFDHFWSFLIKKRTYKHLIFEASLHKKPLRGKKLNSAFNGLSRFFCFYGAEGAWFLFSEWLWFFHKLDLFARCKIKQNRMFLAVWKLDHVTSTHLKN